MKHPLHNSILSQRSHYIVLYCIGGRQAYFLSQNLFIKRVLNYIHSINSTQKYLLLQHRFRPKNLSKRTGQSLSKRNLPGKQFNDMITSSIPSPSSHEYDWNLFSNTTIEKYTIWTNYSSSSQNHITCNDILLNSSHIYFLSNYLELPHYFSNHIDKFHLTIQHFKPTLEYSMLKFGQKSIIHHNTQNSLFTKYDYSLTSKSQYIEYVENIQFSDYFK
jgi:hypothetical protein